MPSSKNTMSISLNPKAVRLLKEGIAAMQTLRVEVTALESKIAVSTRQASKTNPRQYRKRRNVKQAAKGKQT